MGDPDDENQQHVVADLVDDAVSSHANPISFAPLQLQAASGAGTLFQRQKGQSDPLRCVSGERFEFLGGSDCEFDPVKVS